MHSADDTRPDTPWGSKSPCLRVGAFKSLQIRYVQSCTVSAQLMHIYRQICAIILYATSRYPNPQLINFDNFFVPPASERTCVLAEITVFGVQRMAYESRTRILYPLSCEASENIISSMRYILSQHARIYRKEQIG